MPWGPCGEDAKHLLECPPHKSLPMCNRHWEESMALEKALEADPELAKRFEEAVNKVHAESHGDEYN